MPAALCAGALSAPQYDARWLRLAERPAASALVPGDVVAVPAQRDHQAPVPQDVHRPAQCVVRDPVLRRQLALGRQPGLGRELARLDARGDVVGHLDVGQLQRVGLVRRHSHNEHATGHATSLDLTQAIGSLL